MQTRLVRMLATILAAALLFASSHAGPRQDSDREVEADVAPGRTLLDAIRNDLVELRFEAALAAVEAYLSRPGLSLDERAEALILRGQAHVAFGDLDGAARDYREILLLRPGYRPDVALTPKKAMDRFDKARRETIGHVALTLDPPDAKVLVDGLPAMPDSEGRLWLAAGRHTVRAQMPGHDPVDREVQIVADGAVPLTFELLPNARTLIVETEPDGVEVWLDGVAVGSTARDPGDRRGPGWLVLELLPLGEHAIELRRECYRTERRNALVTINLLDRGDMRLDPVLMVRTRSTVRLEGGPAGAEVLIDGSSAGRLPADAHEVCPGRREFAVRFDGRTLWRTTVEMRPSTDVVLRVEPRPNVALYGADTWPSALRSMAETLNSAPGEPLPRGFDPSSATAWRGLRPGADVDLLVAVLPGAGRGESDRWFLHSPILEETYPIGAAPARTTRPVWARPAFGFGLAESARLGGVVVVHVEPGGAAAEAGLAVGDRVARIGGAPVETGADARKRLDAVEPGSTVEVGLIRGAEARTVTVKSRRSPRIAEAVEAEGRALDAAWAVAESSGSPAGAPDALANLALLLSSQGRHGAAVTTWERVRWTERSGVGAGTAWYYLGRELERLGREDEAIAAYRRAAASRGTAFDDDGPAVAPAARDHLVDLGVRLESR